MREEVLQRPQLLKASIMVGFLYAFHTAKKRGRNGLETLVSMLSRSQIVHVEMMPVTGISSSGKLCVSCAYTAFMQRRFGCYSPQLLDEEGTLLLYVPAVDASPTAANFLHDLLGVPYNYVGLPRTLFPTQFRREADPLHVPHEVFCSEAGFQLAYLCGAVRLPHSFECSPAELYSLLLTSPVVKCVTHSDVLRCSA